MLLFAQVVVNKGNFPQDQIYSDAQKMHSLSENLNKGWQVCRTGETSCCPFLLAFSVFPSFCTKELTIFDYEEGQ
jgi:hypothetical protein